MFDSFPFLVCISTFIKGYCLSGAVMFVLMLLLILSGGFLKHLLNAQLVVMHSHNFCFSEITFLPFFFLEDDLAVYTNLGGKLLSLGI